MQFTKLKNLITFCDSIDSDKLAQMVLDAGHPTIADSIQFSEIVRVRDNRVWVEFDEVDGVTCYVTHHGQLSFIFEDGKVTDLELIYRSFA